MGEPPLPLLAPARGAVPNHLRDRGDEANDPACCAAMRITSVELEKSTLRNLMAGALCSAARVSGRGTRTHSACPNCGAENEDKIHVLWAYAEWEQARETWSRWLWHATSALT